MNDQDYMQLAVTEAWKGLGATWTNPRVGAVIVKDGRILARGYHHRFGEPHAEIDAISHLNSLADAKGATIYVTLEPCSHYGKTPPCADRLGALGFSRVVIGQADPNPIVGGKGIDRLTKHGVVVDNLDDTEMVNEAYNFYYRRKRPMVTLKYAMSLDGKINQAGSNRTRLSGSEAWQDSQRLRQLNQAIIVGERTYRVDDPRLTIRSARDETQPLRIILIRDARHLDLNAKLFQSSEPVWILTSHQPTFALPEFVKAFEAPDWSPAAVVKLLSDQGIQSLLVEGGSHVQAAFVAAGLVDKLVAYITPLMIGGTGLSAVTGLGNADMLRFTSPTIQKLGDDIKLTARRDD